MWSKPASQSQINAAMEAYYDDLCRAMRKRGHTPLGSQDIVHDIYVRLMGKPRLPENQSAVKAFLIRACINLGIDHFRRANFEKRLFAGNSEEAATVADACQSAEDTADIGLRLVILEQAIIELSLQRRRVFLASAVGGLTSTEISKKSGLTKNMVDRHLRKAYLHCLQRLEPTL